MNLSDNIDLILACIFKDDNNHKIERYLLLYALDEEDNIKCCTLDVIYLEDSERLRFSDEFWEDFTEVERFEVRYLLDKNINKILYKE